MGNNSSKADWSNVFKQIKEIHDKAYYAIDDAIKLEEQEKQTEAIQEYKKGILLIDEVLAIQVESPEEKDDTWEIACTMIHKMKQTRAEVLMRINIIQSSPSYIFASPAISKKETDVSSEPDCENPRTYHELASALETVEVQTHGGPAKIIFTQNNVRLYYISPDGTVTSAQEPSELNMYLLQESETSAPVIFLQIGDWVYPLIPSVSPCFRTEYGAFIFPDVSGVSGSAVGIKFSNDEDDNEFLKLLENILNGVVKEVSAVTQRKKREASEFGSVVSNTIVNSAYYISQGLIKGAEKTSQLLNYSTPKLINHLSAAENPKPVSIGLIQTFRTVKSVSGSAVQVTGYIANKVGIATASLGRYLAPHIHKQGTRLLSSGFNIPEEQAHDKVDSIFTVAAGAVEGIATVYNGLEQSAQILGTNLTNNTVKIVEHKYGEPAAEITENTLHAVGNIYTASHNLNYLKPKGFIKTTVKEASKAVAYDCSSNNALNEVTFPDLSSFEKESATTQNSKLSIKE